MTYKYNKGEWSELYTFMTVLASGELYAADENLNKISTSKYNVVSAFQKDIEYIRDSQTKKIIFEYQSKKYELPIDKFDIYRKKLFKGIKAGKGSSFSINDVNTFIDDLKITALKAGSKQKGDLLIKIDDIFTATQQTLNFSVKSYIGNKPTLLNASEGTVLNFLLSRTISPSDVKRINNINTSSKIKDRISELKKLNVELNYDTVISPTFKKNLQMIDYRLPELISRLYLESYFVKGKKIPEVVESFIKNNPTEDKDIIVYKIKQLLISVALGMVPLTPWLGLDEANGGYIVVKDNSDVLCYHIYDRNKLSEYLYNHTAFDTPSTKRTASGVIINSDNNQQSFKLTMQIRF